MSLPILREFFNALGITQAPKTIEPPEWDYDVFGNRIVKLRKAPRQPFPYASYEPAQRDPMKAMG